MKLLALLLLVTGSDSLKTVVKIVDPASNATQLAIISNVATKTPQSPVSLASDPDVVTDEEQRDAERLEKAVKIMAGVLDVLSTIRDILDNPAMKMVLAMSGTVFFVVSIVMMFLPK